MDSDERSKEDIYNSLPDFLKREPKEPGELSKLISEYQEKFPGGICTEPYHFSEKQLKRALKKCLATGKDFFEIMHIPRTPEEDEEW